MIPWWMHHLIWHQEPGGGPPHPLPTLLEIYSDSPGVYSNTVCGPGQSFQRVQKPEAKKSLEIIPLSLTYRYITLMIFRINKLIHTVRYLVSQLLRSQLLCI